MKRIFKDNIIGNGTAGSDGLPGSGYQKIEIKIALYDDGIFEAQANFERGSNQGCLQPHESLTTKDRCKNLNKILETIGNDVAEWDCGISQPERRAAIREARMDAEDWMESNWSKEEQIKRLEAAIAELK